MERRNGLGNTRGKSVNDRFRIQNLLLTPKKSNFCNICNIISHFFIDMHLNGMPTQKYMTKKLDYNSKLEVRVLVTNNQISLIIKVNSFTMFFGLKGLNCMLSILRC